MRLQSLTPRRQDPFRLVAAAAVGYALGGLSSADALARRASDGRIDLREWGSRNPGAMNAFRILGPRAGFLVAGADIAKAALACSAGRRLAGATGAHVAGVGAVVGHCYPAARGFAGGKGIAACGGQCLGTLPAYFPLDLAIGVASTAAVHPGRPGGRRALVATAIPAALWVAAGVLWWRRGWPNAWGPEPSGALPLANLASTVVVGSRFALAITRGHPDDLGPEA